MARNRIPMLAAAAVATAVALPAGGAAARVARCTVPRHAHVVVRTAQALVIEFDQKDPRAHEVIRSWGGCWRPTGHATTILDGYRGYGPGLGESDRASDFATAGPYVAFLERTAHKGMPGDVTVTLIDLRTSRQQLDPTQDDALDVTAPPYDIFSLSLGAQGFLAWLVTFAKGTILVAHDSHGSRAIDGGPPGAIGRVAIRGSTLTWVNGAAARSAPLA